LLVSVSLDQARIDGKALATNQTGRNARLDDPLEHTTENISLAEALVAGADGPSWIDPAAIRVNTTESSFAACLNRLLQQNRPEAE
jgi:hypothetical protein